MNPRNWKLQGLVLLSLMLAAVSALAQESNVIPRGVDLWRTPGNGSTVAELHLPPGFLDKDCPAFDGEVVLEGVPVATLPEGAFGNADTVIERLNDAVFDDKGVATAKIVVRALHFRSVAPLETGCGEWMAEVGLGREQAVTKMTIVREDARGGFFTAPISVDTVWTLTRKQGKAVRTLGTSNLLVSEERTPWRSEPCPNTPAIKRPSVIVDVNNDNKADLKVAAASRFFNAGWDLQCKPYSPCRGKLIDPAIHCYEPALSTL